MRNWVRITILGEQLSYDYKVSVESPSFGRRYRMPPHRHRGHFPRALSSTIKRHDLNRALVSTKVSEFVYLERSCFWLLASASLCLVRHHSVVFSSKSIYSPYSFCLVWSTISQLNRCWRLNGLRQTMESFAIVSTAAAVALDVVCALHDSTLLEIFATVPADGALEKVSSQLQTYCYESSA